MKYRRTARAVTLGLLLSAAAARSQLNAHEFIIIPAQLQIESGAKLLFRFKATLVFSVIN